MLRAFSRFGAILRLPMGIFRILKRPNHLEMVGPFQDFEQSRDGPRAFSGFWIGATRPLETPNAGRSISWNFICFTQCFRCASTLADGSFKCCMTAAYFSGFRTLDVCDAAILSASASVDNFHRSLIVYTFNKCIFVYQYQQTTNVWLPMILKHYQHALFTWTMFINISIDNQSERAYNLEMVAQFRDRETDHGQSRDGQNRENAHNTDTNSQLLARGTENAQKLTSLEHT